MQCTAFYGALLYSTVCDCTDFILTRIYMAKIDLRWTVLYCTALYGSVLYDMVLYWVERVKVNLNELYFTVQNCIVLSWHWGWVDQFRVISAYISPTWSELCNSCCSSICTLMNFILPKYSGMYCYNYSTHYSREEHSKIFQLRMKLLFITITII